MTGGLTYNAHLISLAVAAACLQVMLDDDMVGHTQRMGRVLAELHAKMKDKHPPAGDVRSIALFGVLELVRNRRTKEPMARFNATTPKMQHLGAFSPRKRHVRLHQLEQPLHQPAAVHPGGASA